MSQLLLVVFFLALFLVAPLKAALLFSGTLLLASLAVQASASAISRVTVSLGEAFKAIVLSVFFSAVAAFTIFSFAIGAPRELISSGNAGSSLGILALQYGAYVLGFRLALGLTVVHAAMVAVVSTLLTSLSVWFIVKMAAS